MNKLFFVLLFFVSVCRANLVVTSDHVYTTIVTYEAMGGEPAGEFQLGPGQPPIVIPWRVSEDYPSALSVLLVDSFGSVVYDGFSGGLFVGYDTYLTISTNWDGVQFAYIPNEGVSWSIAWQVFAIGVGCMIVPATVTMAMRAVRRGLTHTVSPS